jgi:hypothetical protein
LLVVEKQSRTFLTDCRIRQRLVEFDKPFFSIRQIIMPAAEATGADDDGNYCSGSGECEGMLLCCTMLYTHSFIYT